MKRFLCLLILCAMLVLMAACGETQQTGGGNNEQNASGDAGENGNAEPTPTADIGGGAGAVTGDTGTVRELLASGDIDAAYELMTSLMIAKRNEDPSFVLRPTVIAVGPELQNRLPVIAILTDDLRIRKSPGTSGEIAGMTAKGQRYGYTETSEADGYLWYHIDEGWVADGNGKYAGPVIDPAYSSLIENAAGSEADPTVPETYAGRTVAEVVEAFGGGYSVADFGSDAPRPGLYYADERSEYVFLYADASGAQTAAAPLYADYIVVSVELYRDVEEQAIADRIEWQLGWMR